MHSHNWIIEFRHNNRANMYRVLQTVVSTTSKYQEILIAEVQGFGRALFLDGIPQSSALDKHIYHEVLIHPALVAHKHPKKSLWLAEAKVPSYTKSSNTIPSSGSSWLILTM